MASRSNSAKLLIFVVVAAVAALGCGTIAYPSPTPTPLTGSPAQAFIVSEEAYPSNWDSLPCDSERGRSNDSYYEQFFVPKARQPGQFLQKVFRMNSIEEASAKFAVYRNGEFHKKEAAAESTDFSPPKELPYVSPIADEYYFACGREFGLVCRMIARYENYFVFFYFDMCGPTVHPLQFSASACHT